MKTNKRNRNTDTRSTRRPRRRKKKSIAGAILIEALGFVALILLLAYTRSLTQPETQTIAEPTASAAVELRPVFDEPVIQSRQTVESGFSQSENTARSLRPFRVQFDRR